MTNIDILFQEIHTLPSSCYGEALDFVGYLKQKQRKNTSESLQKAADKAYDDYTNDPELTVFTILDGEDFYETKNAITKVIGLN
jgi:hypothetical protein